MATSSDTAEFVPWKQTPAGNHSQLSPPDPHLSNEEIEQAYAGQMSPEAFRMLQAILHGSQMGPGEGWFGAGESLYSWNWLAQRHGIDNDGAITAAQFAGSAEWFGLLDRDRDGRVTASDLDWSDGMPWVQQSYLVNRMFRRIESAGNGRITREDWNAFFDTAAHGQEHLLFEDLRDGLLGRSPAYFAVGDSPTRETLLRGFFAGEVGSLNAGPQVGERATDFALCTHDGARTICLSELIGSRPLVLTFGNFTCGPFRSMFPGVEEVQRKIGDQAQFVGIYVREAHPEEGWQMESNRRVGVVVCQPRTQEERATIAGRCHSVLQLKMPLLVDDINDRVGNLYSGMPARMYIINRSGIISYKSGRGPFGFKTGEMQQHLIMALLDQASQLS